MAVYGFDCWHLLGLMAPVGLVHPISHGGLPMKRVLETIVLLLLLTGCAHQDEWTRQDTWRQIAVTIAIAGDGVSSVRIRETENIYEAGAIARKVMGSQPTKSDLAQYHFTLAVTSFAIAWVLPPSWRPYWQGFEVGIHGYAWYNNCQLGLC